MPKISTLDNLLEEASAERANFGGYINQLNSILNRLDSKNTNLKSTQSTIEDADIAKESADLMKNQIIQQSSSLLINQANQSPSIALKIIGN